MLGPGTCAFPCKYWGRMENKLSSDGETQGQGKGCALQEFRKSLKNYAYGAGRRRGEISVLVSIGLYFV